MWPYLSAYLKPEVAQAAQEALQQAGFNVTVPKSQGCCGLPALGVGETKTAIQLAQRNLDAFLPQDQAEPEYITTACASCAIMLKKDLPRLFALDSPERQRAQRLAEKVVPFSRLWIEQAASTQTPRFSAGDKTRVTYHDPCHLSRGFGEKDAPRRLLSLLPGVEFVEMNHPCHCCGHGGSFSFSHYDLSLAIAADKVQNIIASKAKVVVTECMGCLLQLSEMLDRAGANLEVITTAEAHKRFFIN
jgi:glycolate oxidase iron-sulfur subunit